MGDDPPPKQTANDADRANDSAQKPGRAQMVAEGGLVGAALSTAVICALAILMSTLTPSTAADLIPIALTVAILPGFGVLMVGALLIQWRRSISRTDRLIKPAILVLPVLLLTSWTMLVAKFALEQLEWRSFLWATGSGPAGALVMWRLVLPRLACLSFGLPRYSRTALFPAVRPHRLPVQSVVQIITFDGCGNGFVVSSDGWIVTASHVVMGHEKIWVILSNHDMLPATIHALKPEWDCALLRLQAPYPLRACRLSTVKNVRLGDELIMLGWRPPVDRAIWAPRHADSNLPTPLDEPSVIPLRVSQVSNPPTGQDWFPVLGLIGSTSVGPGLSGSAICRPASGRVVAINCWGNQAWDTHMAVPADLLRDFVAGQGIRCRRDLLWRMPWSGSAPLRQRRSSSDALWGFWNVACSTGFMDLEAMRAWTHLSDDRADLDQLVAVLPEFASAFRARGWVRWALGDWTGAKEDAERALEITTDDAAYRLLIEGSTKAGDWAAAAMYAAQWLENSPNLADAQCTALRADVMRRLAEALRSAGRASEALTICEQAEEVYKTEALLWEKAYCHVAVGDLAQARDAMLEVLEINPMNGLGRYDLAKFLAALGGHANCRQALAEVALASGKLATLPADYLVVMANALDGTGFREGVRQRFLHFSATRPESWRSRRTDVRLTFSCRAIWAWLTPLSWSSRMRSW